MTTRVAVQVPKDVLVSNRCYLIKGSTLSYHPIGAEAQQQPEVHGLKPSIAMAPVVPQCQVRTQEASTRLKIGTAVR